MKDRSVRDRGVHQHCFHPYMERQSLVWIQSHRSGEGIACYIGSVEAGSRNHLTRYLSISSVYLTNKIIIEWITFYFNGLDVPHPWHCVSLLSMSSSVWALSRSLWIFLLIWNCLHAFPSATTLSTFILFEAAFLNVNKEFQWSSMWAFAQSSLIVMIKINLHILLSYCALYVAK